jgi:hypothetical protein
MLAGLDGVLLGGQAERVVAQAVQDVLAGHPLEAGVDVGGDVAQRVADVQPGTGGVGEHVQDEQLLPARDPLGVGPGTGRVRGVERALALPPVLPAQLDALGQLGGVAVRGVVHRLRPSVEVCGRCSCGAPDGRTQKNPSA